MAEPAVVLVSGGLDSAVTLALAQRDGYECHALTFDYGQRHDLELESARMVAGAAGVSDHRVVAIDLRAFGGSALTDEIDVPKHRSRTQIDAGIPVTYVPARNTIFLSFALAFGEVLGTGEVFCGVNALDYSGYPDCRPAYIEAFERMANLATRAAVEGSVPVHIRAPLIDRTKAEIIRTGLELGVDLGITTSCYDPTPAGACGACDACTLRLRGFAEVGVTDPAPYR